MFMYRQKDLTHTTEMSVEIRSSRFTSKQAQKNCFHTISNHQGYYIVAWVYGLIILVLTVAQVTQAFPGNSPLHRGGDVALDN